MYMYTKYVVYLHACNKKKFKLWKSYKLNFVKNQNKKKVKTLFDSKFYADSEYVIFLIKEPKLKKKTQKNVICLICLISYYIDTLKCRNYLWLILFMMGRLKKKTNKKSKRWSLDQVRVFNTLFADDAGLALVTAVAWLINIP